MNLKNKLIKLLIKHGSNANEAAKLVEKHIDYLLRVYPESSNSHKCDVMMTLG